MIRSILFLSFVLFFDACQKANESSEAVAPATPVTFNVNSTTMLRLVNNVRKAGCNCGTTVMPPVEAISWNEQLSRAAYAHSKDMQAQNYFDHISKNGSDPGTRIRNAGYAWRIYGENIAKGYADEQAVMDGWIKSEGHCKNIMSPAFKEMGAGRESSYWTQEFGAK